MKISQQLAAMALSFTCTAALMLAASPARAEEAHGTVIAGIGTVPDYEGADDQRVIPLAGGRVMFGNRYIALEGLRLSANVLENETFEFGPVATLTFKRDAKIKSAAVAALGPIKDAYELGVFAAASLPLGGDDRIRFALQGVQDVANAHKGWLGTASASYIAPIGSKVRVIADVSATYASGDYMRRYYTVSASGAAASGLAQFAAKSGVKDIGLTLTTSYQLSPKWSVVGFAGYKRLMGSAKDSPVVAREGNANQLRGGIGIGYSF
jgi:hypothetical protein